MPANRSLQTLFNRLPPARQARIRQILERYDPKADKPIGNTPTCPHCGSRRTS